MDRKSISILIVCFALLLLWPSITSRLFPPVPDQPGSRLAGQTNGPIATNVTNAAATATAAAANTTLTAGTNRVAALLPVRPRGPEETLVLENNDVRYTFTSHGGGVKAVELKDYPATVDCRKARSSSTNLATLNANAPTPALALFGGPALEDDGSYRLTRTASGVRAEKSLTNGLHVIKDFHLGTNYVVKAVTRLENRSPQPLTVPAQEWVLGTATPIGNRDESLALGFEWYDGSSATKIDQTWFDNRTLGCLPGRPRSEYVAGASNVVWAAVHNQFFAIIVTPGEKASQVTGRRIALPPPSAKQLRDDPKTAREPFGFQTAFLYPSLTLAPAQALERTFDVYAGPKEYFTLSRLPANVDLVMGFGGFWGFFAKALLLSMNGLHSFVPSYGVAIIAITVIIKLLFWPLTTASTRSMKRMAALQPQMKALQEKYKDDPKKMNMKLMEFMKQNKVSPLGGCLPMMLQIPVFFGFYTMLQSAIELRGASFLWACDLSQADTLFVIPGLNFPVNPMPLLMGVTMLWQAQLTPPSPGMDPVQQKIMKYMPLMFMVFLYSFSAGLTLYWTVQNLLTIAQMKLTRTNEPAGPTPPPAAAARRPVPRAR